MRPLALDLSNRAHWLIRLRWVACAGVVGAVWLASSVLGVVARPAPLYATAAAMGLYNLVFWLLERRRGLGVGHDGVLVLQIALDQIALTLLLYFSSISHNPFIFFFVFHIIVGALLLRGRVPYLLAALASGLVGSVLLLQYLGWLPVIRMDLPHLAHLAEGDPQATDGLYLTGLFLAFSSTLWITVYFTSSLQRYVHQAQEQVRQKEKMLGIGQLVAGIAHQISNPLDGLQNGLRIIGEHVTGDDHLHKYIGLMSEALQRIERTAKRVQTFARPRGLKLRDTDVNRAVESTLQILGDVGRHGVEIVTDLKRVPPVMGDHYTLQEVVFNLCTNALAAMPDGGTLEIRTSHIAGEKFSRFGHVGIEVADTGVGIPERLTEKIFEPFFTTRADAGGTGLGLGLCRMLISEMGGRIDVESCVGEGTTFRIALSATDGGTRKAEHESPDR